MTQPPTRRGLLLVALTLWGVPATAWSDDTRPVEKARRTYLGRIVAQPMSHLGADWLVRPERDDEEQARKALAALDVQPGMTVVDLGCGNGYWTLPLARACKSEAEATQPTEGQVLAVDIQREMLAKLRRNLAIAKIDNVQLILGDVDDPKLPEAVVEMVLMVDVYHEFSHPETMLWHIRRSLAPTGVIALLEYRAEDPNVPIKPLHKMSKVQIMKEYEASRLKLVREVNDLPWQHLMFFARDDSPLPAVEPTPFKN